MRTLLSILILLALTVLSVSAQSHVTQAEAVLLMDGTNGSASNGTANETDMLNIITSVAGWGGPDNPQTGTTYTMVEEDAGRLLTLSNASAIAVTLPQAGTTGFEDGSWFPLKNIGAGTVTVTPTTSTIDGGATLVLLSGQWASIYSDGTNYRSLFSTDDHDALTNFAANEHTSVGQFGFMLGADNGDVLVDGDDQPTIFANRLGFGVTITEVWCESDAGTPIINLQRDDGTPADVLSSNLTCTTSGATGTIDTDEDNVANTNKIDFVMVTAGGVAKRVSVFVKYSID